MISITLLTKKRLITLSIYFLHLVSQSKVNLQANDGAMSGIEARQSLLYKLKRTTNQIYCMRRVFYGKKSFWSQPRTNLMPTIAPIKNTMPLSSKCTPANGIFRDYNAINPLGQLSDTTTIGCGICTLANCALITRLALKELATTS